MNTVLLSFENITELNEYLIPFPDIDDIFVEHQSWLKNHFLPLISIDLGMLNDEWKGQIVHLLNPIESVIDYVGHFTKPYHNEFVGENYISFKLTNDNRYEFLGDERYFVFHPSYQDKLKDLLSFDWRFENISNDPDVIEKTKIGNMKRFLERVQKTKESFIENKEQFDNHQFEGCYLSDMGGKIPSANWVDAHPIPSAYTLTDEMIEGEFKTEIFYQGNPFYHIASVPAYMYSDGADSVILMYEPISRIVLFTFDYS